MKRFFALFIVVMVYLTNLNAQDSTQRNDRKVNRMSYINMESIAIITPDGERWFMGKKLDDIFTRKANTSISSDLFGVKFGPINGFKSELMQIGWNNQNRVLYIEVFSRAIKTNDGLAIGDTQEKVLKTLGLPYIETSNQYRYQNVDFEVVGIIFQFENERIKKIILYCYV
jgi:hypothetical protein